MSFIWWEEHVWQNVKIRQKHGSPVYSLLYYLTPHSLSLSPCLFITPSTPNSPCLSRWPFRVQPRWIPRVHSAFRLSATFEHPWSAATYTHRHWHINTHALSTLNLKWCKGDIQLYIKCTNTHIHLLTPMQIHSLHKSVILPIQPRVWFDYGLGGVCQQG